MPIPQTVLTVTASISGDNTVLTITDTTPVGVSTTGYNQTGGLQLSEVIKATLETKRYFPDGSTSTTLLTIFPTAFNALPFIQGEVYTLQMDSFGGAVGYGSLIKN